VTIDSLPQIDVNIPRFNQALVAVLTGVAFVLQLWQIVAVVFTIVTVTRLAGPQYGMFTQIYVRIVRPRRRQPVETEWSAPPRFAQLLAVIFLGAAIVAFITGFDTAAWTITLVVTALATLAATARICVGCNIYQYVVVG
jgi:hypothetical protein